MNGFLLIDKPCGPTSFDAVRAIRSALGPCKAGHAGTLDPSATGLLVVALNDATRLLPFLPLEPKEYAFSVQFGTETDTLDQTGTVVESGKPIPQAGSVPGVLARFTGPQLQQPPRYSAVKIGGIRAYQRARNKESFDPAARSVTIHSLNLEGFDEEHGLLHLRMVCSAGTYVRALARDLGRALGSAAHTVSIRRLRVGRFDVRQAVPLDRLGKNPGSAFLDIRHAFDGFPFVAVDRHTQSRIAHGMDVILDRVLPAGDGNGLMFLTGEGGAILALVRPAAGGAHHPLRVFTSSDPILAAPAISLPDANSCAS